MGSWMVDTLTLSAERLETTNVRVVSWLYAVRSFDASNRAPNHRPKWGRQSDCHAISLSKERDRSRADAATTERISWLFRALAPCGVPFDCLRLALWQNWVEKNVLPQVSLLHSLSVLPVRVNDYGRAENMLWQFDTICMFVNELGSAKLYIRSQKTITMMLPKRWRTELWKM